MDAAEIADRIALLYNPMPDMSGRQINRLHGKQRRLVEDLAKEISAGHDWQPIETAPQNRKSVLLIAPYPTGGIWSDPRAGWHDGLSWVRWPHSFQPTHWAPIPEPPYMDA